MNEVNTQVQHMTVCGGVLNNPENYPFAIHNGKRIYFCTKACLRAFQQAPEAFTAGEVEHPLDEDEKLFNS